MTDQQAAMLAKYKDIMVRALRAAEHASDRTGVQVGAEADKFDLVPSRVLPDKDTIRALKELHSILGRNIRIIVDATHEYQSLGLEDDLSDIEI